jgi:hypothetical protein
MAIWTLSGPILSGSPMGEGLVFSLITIGVAAKMTVSAEEFARRFLLHVLPTKPPQWRGCRNRRTGKSDPSLFNSAMKYVSN